jgi:hypothetical protein
VELVVEPAVKASATRRVLQAAEDIVSQLVAAVAMALAQTLVRLSVCQAARLDVLAHVSENALQRVPRLVAPTATARARVLDMRNMAVQWKR